MTPTRNQHQSPVTVTTSLVSTDPSPPPFTAVITHTATSTFMAFTRKHLHFSRRSPASLVPRLSCHCEVCPCEASCHEGLTPSFPPPAALVVIMALRSSHLPARSSSSSASSALCLQRSVSISRFLQQLHSHLFHKVKKWEKKKKKSHLVDKRSFHLLPVISDPVV